ncbi:tryptophan 2,3-dioxygenase family protein [Amycolatopsis nigrescens]|uniref:tryptophan 2,3-dioxygenase family protein n=1 Tax=Amycolatopsis nigrescens TaxID=381445 RepID=UPI0012F77655|nr:tryptophan 2,3-dioxygenase family protein [Amycolatopsis nigrescens]
MTYSRYLHLKELLALQHPLTPPEQEDLCDSERLFIVVHQASEILLGQALTDLRHLEANQCGARCFRYRAERATRLIDALEGHLTLLRQTLDPADFLRFRDLFGTASGMQSAQFHELFELTERLPAMDIGHSAATELRDAVRRWRRTHLQLVQYMIGNQPGSGETSGLRYLARRLNGKASGEIAGCPVGALPRTRS